jgi:calmodulin
MAESLPENKVLECMEIFDLFDKDKDGAISDHELGDALRALGGNPNPKEIEEMINAIDKNDTGKVEFKEFIELFAKKFNPHNDEVILHEVFKKIDKDGNGVISAQELLQMMTTWGEKLTEQEALEIIKEADTDQDGSINYKEFVKMILSK